ncbi:MAG: 2-amino-4-hydroxy-6-hydroxymethyldihydropteridine diphosphokinase [Myxococcota bacterium]
MRRVWIGLGANLGDRRRTLEQAVRWLDATSGVEVQRVSTWRETPPMGPPQPSYLNGVVRVLTAFSPMEMLTILRQLEVAAGRVRTVRWGPRTLDLDLLFMEGLVLETPELVLPHPGIPERRFVLEPLCELDSDFVHPVLDRPLSDLLEALTEC